MEKDERALAAAAPVLGAGIGVSGHSYGYPSYGYPGYGYGGGHGYGSGW